MATALKTQIAPTDELVFWDRYDYAVPVVLDRSKPTLVVEDWGPSSHQWPDNWRRELAEGAEFDPTAGRALVTPQQWDQQRHLPGAPIYWVWVEKTIAQSNPWLSQHPVVQQAGDLVVVKVSPQRKAQ